MWDEHKTHPHEADEFLKHNHYHYAKQSGLEIRVITKDNYASYVDQWTTKTINDLLSVIKVEEPFTKKFVIMLHILADHGGLMMFNESLVAVEDFEWLYELHRNPYVNRGNRTGPNDVFAFFDPDYSEQQFVVDYGTTLPE